MGQADGRDDADPELLAGLHAAMARHDLRLGINEHRHVKAKGANAGRDLTNLFLRMQPGILRIDREGGDRARDHLKRTRSLPSRGYAACVACSVFPHMAPP